MPARDGPTPVSSFLKPARWHLRHIFLHFFDVHFLEERGASAASGNAKREMDLATRFAVMLGSKIFVPASSYYESQVAREVLRPFIESPIGGRFVLVGGGSSIEEFREEKLPQYLPGSPQRLAYDVALQQSMGWHRRRRSAGRDISAGWTDLLSQGSIGSDFFAFYKARTDERGFEKLWSDVDERLSGKAWIVDHVIGPLGLPDSNLIVRNKLHSIINRGYFGSYAKDPGASIFQDMLLLGGEIIPTECPENDIQFAPLEKACAMIGILTSIRRALPQDLDEIAAQPEFVSAYAASHSEGTYPLPKNDNQDGRRSVDLAIITALPKELEAVRAVFGDGSLKMMPNDPHLYRIVEMEIAGKIFEVVYATPSAMGNARAAVVGSNLLRSFAPRMTALVGIAGGCPSPSNIETHVRLGDVVISDALVEYDHVKQLPGGALEPRDHPQRASYRWLQATTHLRSGPTGFSEEWRETANQAMKALNEQIPAATQDVLHDPAGARVRHPRDPRRIQGRPIVHVGTIASGDVLLKDPVKRDAVSSQFKARAIEMEGVGMREAVWAQSDDLVVVRGIVDYCDGFKTDQFHMMAAVEAASVLRLMFETLVKAEIPS